MNSSVHPLAAERRRFNEYNQPAFPDLLDADPSSPPSVKVTRSKPPQIRSAAVSSPAPPGPSKPAVAVDQSNKPKSRFALQREREAAERLSASAASPSNGTERFTLDLDELETAAAARNPRLVGEVVEREGISGDGSNAQVPLPPSMGASAFRGSPVAQRRPTGFPVSSHLSHVESTALVDRPPPSASSSSTEQARVVENGGMPSLIASVSQENEGILAGMSDAEILEEQRQIRDLGLPESVIRMLERRGRNGSASTTGLSAGVSRTETARDKSTTATTTVKMTVRIQEPARSRHIDVEEGSPEYIRRHFFPNEPPSSENTSLRWMHDPSSSSSPSASNSTSSSSLLSFDLHGKLLPSSASDHSIHSHEGHKHHASSSSSSSTFTIPTLLTLVTSTVSAQRSTAFQVLSHILLRSEQFTSFGPGERDKLRAEVARSAGWGIKDSNLGVRRSAMDLLAIVFVEEAKSSTRINKKLKGRAEVAIEGKAVQEEVIDIFLATDPFPTFARHLQLGSLPRESLITIVSILHDIVLSSAGGPKSLAVEEFVACKGLLESLSKRFISVPWPPIESTVAGGSDDGPISALPYPPAIELFTLLAKSSKNRARSIWDRNLVDSPLRFFSMYPWEFADQDGSTELASMEVLGYQLLDSTIDLWVVMARYGIGASARTNGTTLFAPLFDHMSSLLDHDKPMRQELRLASKWFDLLTIWTTAAIDPHSTNHDIVWTQVEEWSELIASTYLKLVSQGEEVDLELLASVLDSLSAWMEGSKMNKPWRGEAERLWLYEKVGVSFEHDGRALCLVTDALERLIRTKTIDRNAVIDCQVVLAANRLSSAYEDDSTPITAFLFTLDANLVYRAFSCLVDCGSLRNEDNSDLSWPVISTLVALLPSLPTASRLAATFSILPLLRAGDEGKARELSDWIMINVGSSLHLSPLSSISSALEGPALSIAMILRPFVLHSIITASGGKIAAPYRSSSRDLSISTSQRPFATTSPLLEVDWPLCALNELLRSGSSPVFDNLPPKWDSSELEVVRSSMALMHVAQELVGTMPAALMIYDMIKVFMLEKDNSEKEVATEKSDTDLFRDDAVNYSMVQLLKPLTMAQQQEHLLRRSTSTPSTTTTASLESISAIFSSAPFYSLYTDLVGLYDSISLSHPTFSAILLPPLAMSYPIDYRKLLWINYNHLLRSVNLSLDDAITDQPGSTALSGYCYPVETNGDLLAAYAEALVTEKVKEGTFLYFVAIVQVVETLFGRSTVGMEQVTLATRLSKSIVLQGSSELMRSLLSMRLAQDDGKKMLLAPECFAGPVLSTRVATIEERLVGDAGLMEKFEEWKRKNVI